MKLVLQIILFFAAFLYPYEVEAAVNAAVVWEVRSTGLNTNGGGFKTGASGTDWTQQDSCKYSLTGLTSAGAGNIILTSSAAADWVGNTIQIASGTNFTTGFFEITTVSAGVSATVSTRQDGTAITTGAGVSGVGCIGGGFKLGTSGTDTIFAAGVAPGNTIWIKGSQTIAGGMVFTDCTNAAPCMISGYSSNRNDNPTGSSRPTLTSGGTSNNTGAYTLVQNLIFTGTAATMWTSDGKNTWYNNKFINTSATANRTPLGVNGDLVINNEFISYSGYGFSVNGELNIVGNYFHDSPTCLRITATGLQANVANNIFAGCITNGINVSGANVSITHISGNTIYGAENQIGTGVLVASGAGGVRLTNNIIYGWATGVSAAASTTNWSNWNDFNNNTTARTNWTAGASDITAAPAFSNAAQVAGSAGSVSGSVMTDSGANFSNVVDNQDFLDIVSGTGVTTTPGALLITSHTTTTVTTSPAPGGTGTNLVYSVRTGHNFAPGPNIKALAFPGAFPASLTTGYLGIGAVQRREGVQRGKVVNK